METPEQYTVKTPEDAYYKHYTMWCRDDHKTLPDAMIDAIKEYSYELIKQNSEAITAYNIECKRNDDLQKANEAMIADLKDLCEEHITGRIGNYGFYSSVKTVIIKYSALSKFQPKKDENKN